MVPQCTDLYSSWAEHAITEIPVLHQPHLVIPIAQNEEPSKVAIGLISSHLSAVNNISRLKLVSSEAGLLAPRCH